MKTWGLSKIHSTNSNSSKLNIWYLIQMKFVVFELQFWLGLKINWANNWVKMLNVQNENYTNSKSVGKLNLKKLQMNKFIWARFLFSICLIVVEIETDLYSAKRILKCLHICPLTPIFSDLDIWWCRLKSVLIFSIQCGNMNAP